MGLPYVLNLAIPTTDTCTLCILLAISTNYDYGSI